MNLPANEFIGFYGKIRFWKHRDLKLTKLTILNVELCEFCEFRSIQSAIVGGSTTGAERDRPSCQGGWVVKVGFAFVVEGSWVQFRILGTRA